MIGNHEDAPRSTPPGHDPTETARDTENWEAEGGAAAANRERPSRELIFTEDGVPGPDQEPVDADDRARRNLNADQPLHGDRWGAGPSPAPDGSNRPGTIAHDPASAPRHD